MFQRALGFVNLCAFLSLWVQIQGLLGPEGIRPATEALERADTYFTKRGEVPFLEMPTLAWLTGGSALALHLLCAGGVAASLATLMNRAARPALLASYVLYFSLFQIGGEFLRYQWDLLLLEVTFAAVFYTPRARFSVWLPRLILFKLMFSSGVVKLTSGDPTWSGLTALDYHYWTQPIPHFGGWLAWKLPGHTLSCLLMFAGELALPFLIFLRPRWAFFPLVGLLFVMGATGSYGFFQILGAALCVTLLPDATWRRWLRGRLVVPAPPRHRLRWLLAAPVGYLGLLSVLRLAMLTPRDHGSAVAERAEAAWEAVIGPVESLRLVNGYGLFARMTTRRIEIHVEGSNDGGVTWKQYRFAYKPDDAHDLPLPTVFHMPRLDWQMWFAGLGTCRRNEWFILFQKRLLEGSPPVLGLLANNPFPVTPPKLIRSRTEDFRFADEAREGLWRVDPANGGAAYCPTLSLDAFTEE